VGLACSSGSSNTVVSGNILCRLLVVILMLMLRTIMFMTLLTKAACHVFSLADICYLIEMQVQLNTLDAVIYFFIDWPTPHGLLRYTGHLLASDVQHSTVLQLQP